MSLFQGLSYVTKNVAEHWKLKSVSYLAHDKINTCEAAFMASIHKSNFSTDFTAQARV